MTPILESIYLKLPEQISPLSYDSALHKKKLLELQNLMQNGQLVNFSQTEVDRFLNSNNLNYWAYLLQKIDLSIFTFEEINNLLLIDITSIFNYEFMTENYFISKNNNILYDLLNINLNLNIEKINKLYQSQISIPFFYNKAFFLELFSN